MTYLVLARKYRPRTFQEVVGQEVTIGVLQGALEEGRTGHAYLFCGPRGTGKTTTARIFAKALNCEKGPAREPCCECERCRAAEDGAEVDLVEIDAASHTGVDNIRDLRDQAAYAPMRARFKIYVVDEVHMLSKAAFNALLKTLEEPPPHVVFLFATTERHKVIDTIQSRCQVLQLAPIAEPVITGRLEEIAKLEGLNPGPGVLEEVARRAHGGLRDALSLLDQLLALVGESPTLADLARLGGERGEAEIDRLLTAVENKDGAAVVAALAEFGGDEEEVLTSLLGHLRTALVVSLCGRETPILEPPPSEAVCGRAERLSHETLELWLDELLHAKDRMRLLPSHERFFLELALLELGREESTLSLAAIAQRLEALEARLGAPVREPASKPSPAPAAASAPRPVEVTPQPPTPAPAPPATPREVWERVIDVLAGNQGSLAEVLRLRTRLVSLEGDEAVLRLTDGIEDGERRLLEGKRNVGAVARAFREVTGRETRVVTEAHEKPPPPEKDEFTQEVADLFGGVVEEDR